MLQRLCALTPKSILVSCNLECWVLWNRDKIRQKLWDIGRWYDVSEKSLAIHFHVLLFFYLQSTNIDWPRLMEANNRQLNNLQDTLLQVADRLTLLQHQSTHEGKAVCSVKHLSHVFYIVCKEIFWIFMLVRFSNIVSSELTITISIFSALDLFYAYVLLYMINSSVSWIL